MEKNKISFQISEIITILIIIIIIKLVVFYYPTMKPYFAINAYNSVIGDFEIKTIKQLKERPNDLEDSSFYYIGRSSCIDCQESIINIKKLSDLLLEDYNIKMYYVKLDDKISDNEKSVLNTLEVCNIPLIMAFRDGTIYRFNYDEITSNNYEEKFRSFVKEIKE